MKTVLRRAAAMSVAAPLALTGAVAAHAEGPDVEAPQIVEYSVTSDDGDDDLKFFVEHEPATFTATVRITDETGLDTRSSFLNPGNPTVLVDSVDTDQSVGFGQMELVSGDEQDGIYEKTFTIPEGHASGEWEVEIYPLDDTLGNGTDLGEFAFFGTLGVVDIVYGTPVSPAAVTFNDDARSYTIPTTEGAEYLVNGEVVDAGTYNASGTVEITAQAMDGYILDGESAWTHTFTAQSVTADEVTFDDGNGLADDNYTIPTTVGVEYLVNDEVVEAGTHDATGTVTVTARALPGYELSGTTTWTHEFDATTTVTAEAPAFNDDARTYAIPSTEGVEYLVDGAAVEAGTHEGIGTVEITAVATDGYAINGQATWTHTFTAQSVTAEAPAFADRSGSAEDSFTIPAADGVEYLVNGEVVEAGDHDATGTVTVTARALSGYELAGPTTWTHEFAITTPFIDVEPGVEHFEHMAWMAESEISYGWSTPDGPEYRALNNVNRDAMAAFLYRMAGSPTVDLPASSPFTDMHPGQEHYKEVVWAYQEGITTGWTMPDGTHQFRPIEPINRDAMAAFMHRFAGAPELSAPDAKCFADVPTGMMYAEEMCWMKSEGLSNGWSDGTYRPLTPVKRDAMAAFLHRFDTNL